MSLASLSVTSDSPTAVEAGALVVGVRSTENGPELLHGDDPALALCDLAERTHPELLVVATHGRSGVSRVLLGSVAERVARYAPCPVLTVRR